MIRKNYLDNNERIPTYDVEAEYKLMLSLPDSKPSKRMVTTKKGLRAIKALLDLKKNHNVSWYRYVKERNINNFEGLALFYRGNKISFKQMFAMSDKIAQSMSKIGLCVGDEIGVCISNIPELVYIILAANKIGIKVNPFDAGYDKEFLSSIIDDISKKILFISDDNYEQLKDMLMNKNISNIVVTSRADSLLEHPELSDEYEAELDSYYHYENKTEKILGELPNSVSLSSFIDYGKNYSKVKECGNLETDFLITYTSGSTKIGFPKAIIHKNRSLITMGRFHDPELCGNPKIPGLRGLAHIHPNSNTDIITCISDNLIQGWSVALEPEYDKDKALDYVILNKPNYLNITPSFLLEMAKQYLIDKKHHQNGVGKKLPFLLATFAVGEKVQKGEEKFINKFLRVSKAGSGVSIKGLKLPFTTLSIGGGDCEHGGIYYTLWKGLYQKLYKPLLRKNEMGLLPVPYAVVTALKKDINGNYVECDYNEPGIIVANSYTNLSGYKNNKKATNDLIIEDNLGRKWVSCNVYGSIDKISGVHIKGRILEKRNNLCEIFEIDDVITMDSKNILSSTSVEIDNKIVSSIQLAPAKKAANKKIFKSMYQRLEKNFSPDILDSIYIRIIPTRESYPLTGSGKRSVKLIEQMEFENTIKMIDLVNQNAINNIKSLARKK